MENSYLHKRVMVIDDNTMDYLVTSAVIKKNKFAEEIAGFSFAFTAITHLKSLVLSPDLLPSFIFLDINMPEMDGFDFLDSYLKLPEHVQNRITVIMISATDAPQDFERMKDYPVVKMFFQKPLSSKKLTQISENSALALTA